MRLRVHLPLRGNPGDVRLPGPVHRGPADGAAKAARPGTRDEEQSESGAAPHGRARGRDHSGRVRPDRASAAGGAPQRGHRGRRRLDPGRRRRARGERARPVAAVARLVGSHNHRCSRTPRATAAPPRARTDDRALPRRHALPEGEAEDPPGSFGCCPAGSRERTATARASSATLRPQTRWPIAHVASVDWLADRLELSAGQLAWLADVQRLGADRPRPASSATTSIGGSPRSGLPRVIEAPKARLKEVQRWVLREILDHVPPHARRAWLHSESLGASPMPSRTSARRPCSASTSRTSSHRSPQPAVRPLPHARLQPTSRGRPDRPHHKRRSRGIVWSSLSPATDPRLIQPRFWLGRRSQRRTSRRAPDLAGAREPRRLPPRPAAFAGSQRAAGCATRATPTT